MDESVLMAGAGNSVLDRAVATLLVLGISVVVASLCLHILRANLRLVQWAIRRLFHSCAACHARGNSVALWVGLDGRSPLWLCAECAFRLQDSDEVPHGGRPSFARLARLAAQWGRAAAAWGTPTLSGGGKHRRRRRVEPAVGITAVRRTPSVSAGRHRRRAATV